MIALALGVIALTIWLFPKMLQADIETWMFWGGVALFVGGNFLVLGAIAEAFLSRVELGQDGATLYGIRKVKSLSIDQIDGYEEVENYTRLHSKYNRVKKHLHFNLFQTLQ